jgi:predicted RNA binding protein YcfA (HicA-like mRNA interferase family)
MSEKLPRITAQQAIKVLEKIGFVCVRQSGSHKIYKNAEGRLVTVPYYSEKILHPKVFRNILGDADLSVERLKERMR